MPYLIVCPLVFLGGLVDAIAGGGGLITLPAYILAGIPTYQALATNKIGNFPGTLFTTIKYAKEGFIPLKPAILGIIFGMLGSILGTNAVLSINEHYVKIAMIVILPLAAAFIIKSGGYDKEKKAYTESKTLLFTALTALVVGFYDGIYGPGAGTFMMLGLYNLAHYDVNKSNGITKVINSTSNFTAIVVYFINGKLMIKLGLIASLFGVLGNYFGQKLFISDAKKYANLATITVIVIFITKLLLELILK